MREFYIALQQKQNELTKANVAVNLNKYDEYIKPIEEFFDRYMLDWRQPAQFGKTNLALFNIIESKDLPVPKIAEYQGAFEGI